MKCLRLHIIREEQSSHTRRINCHVYIPGSPQLGAESSIHHLHTRSLGSHPAPDAGGRCRGCSAPRDSPAPRSSHQKQLRVTGPGAAAVTGDRGSAGRPVPRSAVPSIPAVPRRSRPVPSLRPVPGRCCRGVPMESAVFPPVLASQLPKDKLSSLGVHIINA